MNTNKEKGFTLVEVLAALTILGIVFISYMTIFPQMVNMNERTETKLETMNIAKQELGKLKKYSPEWPPYYKFDPNDSTDSKVKYKTRNGIYNIEVLCVPRKDGDKEQLCSKSKTESENREENLYEIYIEVKDKDKLVSETFGYLKLK